MRSDRASIEAEVDLEIARHGLNVDFETLAARVAARLGVDAASCLAIAKARLAGVARQESRSRIGFPGKVPSHLVQGRPLAMGPIAPGKRSVSHDSFYRTRVASSVPGKQTLTSLLPTKPARQSIESIDDLRELLGLDSSPAGRNDSEAKPTSQPAVTTELFPEAFGSVQDANLKPQEHNKLAASGRSDEVARTLSKLAGLSDVPQISIESAISDLGYAEGGVIGLRDADAGGPAAEHVLAHEMAHLAQAKLEGPEFPRAAETEANELASHWLRGAPRTAQIPIAASRRAAYQSPDTDGTSEPTGESPIVVDGNRARVLAAWFWQDPTARKTFSSGKTLAPSKTPGILRKLKSVYTWFEDKQIAASGNEVRWMIRAKSRDDKFLTLHLNASAFQFFGLPPGAQVRWFKNGNGAQVLYSHDLLPSEALADPSKPFVLPHALRKRSAEKLHSWVGKELAPGVEAQLVAFKQKTSSKAGNKAVRVYYDRAAMETLVGSSSWTAFLSGAGAGAPGAGVTVRGGMRFTDDVDEAGREYYQNWVSAYVPWMAPTGRWQIPVSLGLIRVLRDLDKNEELKRKVIAELHKGGQPLRSFNSVSFRSLVRRVEIADKRAEFGLGGRFARSSARQPKYSVPVRGAIINRGGLVYQGKSIELEFELHSRIKELAVPSITIQWFVHLKDDRTQRRQEKIVRYMAHHGPKPWSVVLGRRGTYVVHAIVNHDMFEENYFSTEIEVKTKDERQRELNQEAFGHMGRPRSKEHNFDTSWSNEKLGDDEYDKGLAYESVLPKDFEGSGYSTFEEFIVAEKGRMDRVIEAYAGRDPLLVRTAKRYKSRLEGMEGDVSEDKKEGFVAFEVNGAFLSEKNGVPDKRLRLLGVVRQTKRRIAGQRLGDGVVQVKIHDTSFVTERVKFEFDGEGKTFMAALEKAFVELCKSYPPGRVAVMAEQLDDSLNPTGSGRGFELETGTAWKDIKSVAWDPTVQMIANIGGALAMVFVPGLMPVVFPALIGYNATDTLDNLAQLRSKGILTAGDTLSAATLIGLDFMPFLGRLKVVQKFGKVGLYGLEAVEVGAQALVMTHEGIQMLETLRQGTISKIGKLLAERDALSAHIDVLGQRNKSDPQLGGLKKKLATLNKTLDDKVIETRKASKVVFDKLVTGYAFMLGGMASSKVIGDQMAGRNSADAFEPGSFEHKKGVTPRYDPETGRVVGDREKLHSANIEDLKNAQLAERHQLHAEFAAQIGVDPTRVIVERGGRGKATLRRDGDDFIVKLPWKRAKAKGLADVWAARKGQKGAPKSRPKLPGRTTAPTFSPKDIATKQNIVVGRPVSTMKEGKALLERLAVGDASAFAALGVKTPKGYDSRTNEWGLGEMPDGTFIIIRGEGLAVDWSPFPGVRPIAHSHPDTYVKRLKGEDLAIEDVILGKAGWKNQSALMPSDVDLMFLAERGVAVHTVITPYRHRGDGKIANSTGPADSDPQITFEITRPRRVGTFGDLPVYKARLVAYAGERALWIGEIHGTVHPYGPMLTVDPPAGMRRRGEKSEKRDSSSGTDGADATEMAQRFPDPKNDAEAQAKADYEALMADPTKNYRDELTPEQWYKNYNDEKRYDRTINSWVRPDGRKVKIVEIPHGTKPKSAHRLLLKHSKSFRDFQTMLKREGIATDSEIVQAIAELGPLGGTTVGDLRHALKEKFKPMAMERMINPEPELMKKKHADLFAGGASADEAMKAAKHREMIRITGGLNPSDYGNMTEGWYAAVHHSGPVDRHVHVKADEMAEQSIKLTKPSRFIDIRDGGLGVEVKRHEGKLAKKDKEQFEDYRKMLAGQAIVGGKPLQRLRYVFASTEGAVANAETIGRWLRQLDPFEVQVFDRAGNGKVITSSRDFADWLRQNKDTKR